MLFLNVPERVGGKAPVELHVLWESPPLEFPAFESELDREVVTLLKKDM